MKRAIELAIEEIRRSVQGSAVVAEPDADGGAFVTVDGIGIGPSYDPATSFIGFHITFQYPHADIYPHFVVAALARKDGRPLGEGFHQNREWITPTKTVKATMVSRKSNHMNAAVDTAATKLQKVIEWIRSR